MRTAYDSLNRLDTVTGTYSDDPVYDGTTGNLISKGGVNLVYGTQSATCPDGALTKAHAAIGAGTNTYCYDPDGNMVKRNLGGTVYTLTYDAEGRLVGVTGGGATASFVYNGDGNRVSSTINGVTTSYIGNYFEWTGSASTMVNYYYAGSARVAQRQGTGAAQCFLDDHLGSTSLTVDANGNLTAELRYKAWGETRYMNGSTPTTYRFTGQKQEVALGGAEGQYFYNARWYDPYLNRWSQPDSIIPDPNDPQSYDRYAYARNNPVRYNDPTGHDFWDAVGQFATGFVAEVDRSFLGSTPQLQGLYGPSSNESDAMLAGRLTADVVQIVSGIAALDTGAGGVLVGASACATGVGCPGGVVVAAGGVAAVGVGSVAVVQGAIGLGGNLAMMKGNLLGENGTQVTSKTIWQGKQGRLDVENPNPGQRPGQIHFQQGDNKWIYDPSTNSFIPAKGTTIDPPNWLNDLLEQKDFQSAIQKGLQYLGEDQ